jgi:hypothetical protein
VRAILLAELSHLFSLEAFEADLRLDPDEADRLWDISDELRTEADFEPPTRREQT